MKKELFFLRSFASALLFLPLLCRGQALLEVIDDFNSGTENSAPPGWTHYDPGRSGNQAYSWTFPDDGRGGKAYRIIGPPLNCIGNINRGGSYRSEQYTEFFQSVDILNFDRRPYQNFVILGARIATPGAGTTSGYFAGYSTGSPRAHQEAFTALEFTGEFVSAFMDIYRGGTAVTSQFPPSRQLRGTFSGTNVTLKAELYDRTDLLEPIVRINFEDDVNPTAHSAGENLIGFLNVDINASCDFTFDNYHSTA